MIENVTVDEALNKGRWKLVYLPMIVLFSCIGLSFYIESQKILDGWIIAVGFIVGFLLSWIVWSYFVVDWKVWAFENVRNVHELQRKAIEQRLIWSEGSWFEKTEFKSYEQKQKLKQLEKKFLEKDFYHDDLSVPKETNIYFSKSTIFFEFAIGMFLVGIGVYLYITIEMSNIFWILLPIIGIYNLYTALKKYLDKAPQVIINDLGIKVKKGNLVTWNEVSNDRVFNESHGKSSTNYFAFNNEKISIDDLDITFAKLENLLHVYRVRYEKNNPSES